MASKVEGADALFRKLALIPQSVLDAVRLELEKQATEIVEMMKRFAPVEDGVLRNSIGWTWGDAPAGSMTIGTVKSPDGGKQYASMRITIYAGGKVNGRDAFYARFQEFGTLTMPANPFFFPAYRLRSKAAKTAITKATRKAIRDAG